MANSYETYAQTKVETTCYNTKIYWQKQLVRPQAYLSEQQIHSGTNKQFTFQKYKIWRSLEMKSGKFDNKEEQ